MEWFLNNGYMPSGGLQEVKEVVRQRIEELKEKLPTLTSTTQKKAFYNQSISTLLSLMYSSIAQGRQNGITTLKLKHYRELIENSHVLTSTLKTRATHGYQSINITEEIGEFLKFFMRKTRPLLLNVYNKETLYDEDSYLLPAWLETGIMTPVSGSLVRSFFRTNMNLHMGTNSMRSLFEMTSRDMLDDGKISSREFRAVQSNNGHSSAISEDYYLHNNISDDAKRCRRVAQVLSDPTNNFNPIVAENMSSISRFGTGSASAYGKRHPQRSDCLRAKFSLAELQWLRDFITKRLDDAKENEEDINEVRATITPQALDAIRADRNAWDIFHCRHVLDSTRLRPGIDVVLGKDRMKRRRQHQTELDVEDYDRLSNHGENNVEEDGNVDILNVEDHNDDVDVYLNGADIDEVQATITPQTDNEVDVYDNNEDLNVTNASTSNEYDDAMENGADIDEVRATITPQIMYTANQHTYFNDED